MSDNSSVAKKPDSSAALLAQVKSLGMSFAETMDNFTSKGYSFDTCSEMLVSAFNDGIKIKGGPPLEEVARAAKKEILSVSSHGPNHTEVCLSSQYEHIWDIGLITLLSALYNHRLSMGEDPDEAMADLEGMVERGLEVIRNGRLPVDFGGDV